MLEWLILGGGVHGTYLSNVLVRQAGVAPDRLRVLDPHDRPLDAFWRFTRATGMRYLRSPSVHHLDLHPYALHRFAERGIGRRIARFVYPYDRPGLEFFRAHTEHVVREHRLDELRTRGRAQSIARIDGGYRVETEAGSIESRRVILAIGAGEQPCRPSWAAAGVHVFDPAFDRDALVGSGRVLIAGGGISAAQLACYLARSGTPVTVVARHTVRVHRFDSGPEWLGPKAMSGFLRTSDIGTRRRMIDDARHRGSMPPEIARDLAREQRAGRIAWIEAHVASARTQGGAVRLGLGADAGHVVGAHLVLATGFEPHRPGGALLDDEAVERLGLPCAACGYPIVSPQLQWAPGLFVSGPLAELELGPIARNIAGARAAAERLLAAA
jgi:cation diffusion facilitator CzcD-associated flavoprotein CzcO